MNIFRKIFEFIKSLFCKKDSDGGQVENNGGASTQNNGNNQQSEYNGPIYAVSIENAQNNPFVSNDSGSYLPNVGITFAVRKGENGPINEFARIVNVGSIPPNGDNYGKFITLSTNNKGSHIGIKVETGTLSESNGWDLSLLTTYCHGKTGGFNWFKLDKDVTVVSDIQVFITTE